MTSSRAIDAWAPEVLVVDRSDLADALDGLAVPGAEGPLTASTVNTLEEALESVERSDPDCVVVTDAGSVESIPGGGPPVVVYAAREGLDDATVGRLAGADGIEYVPTAADTPDHDVLVAAVRRQVSSRLVRSDRDFRATLMDGAGVGITVADMNHPDDALIYANESFFELTGYPTNEVLGRNCRFLQGEGTDPGTVAEIRQAIDAEEPVSVDIRNYRYDGTPFWNHLHISPIRDDDGTVSHYVGYQKDITERKRAEEERRRFVELTADPSLSFEEKVDEILALGCERFGVEIAFLSAISDEFEVVRAQGDHEKIQPGVRAPLSTTYCRKAIERDEPLTVRNAVEEGWADDPAYEVYDLGCYIGAEVTVEGELYGTLCFADWDPREESFSEADQTFVDMVANWASHELERRQRQHELQRQNDRLEEFASFVSHDLRNPLTVARGNVEALATDLEGEHGEQAKSALESIDRMESLIEGVLRLARDGESVDQPEHVDLAVVVNLARRNVGAEDLSIATTGELGTVLADPERLQTVLENLARNAAEHGGATTVEVGPTDDGFYVADDGTGIPPEDRDDVFDRGFTTADDGTGLGLAIVRTIADAHGWTVSVGESDDGGTRIAFGDVERP